MKADRAKAVPKGRTPYDLLGVANDADEAIIAAAYRVRAKQRHPDTAGPDASRRAALEREMADINVAHDILTSPSSRADLDSRLAAEADAAHAATRRAVEAMAQAAARQAPEPRPAATPAPARQATPPPGFAGVGGTPAGFVYRAPAAAPARPAVKPQTFPRYRGGSVTTYTLRFSASTIGWVARTTGMSDAATGMAALVAVAIGMLVLGAMFDTRSPSSLADLVVAPATLVIEVIAVALAGLVAIDLARWAHRRRSRAS